MNPHIKQRGVLNFTFLITLGLILFFIFSVAYFFYGLEPSRASSNFPTPVEFRIVKGEGFKEIGARLSQKSIVKSIGVFKIYSIL